MVRTGLVLLVAALVLVCGVAPVFAAEVIYDFPLDSDPGWYRTGSWEFGTPLGNEDDPSSGYTGSNVFGNNLAGAYANDIGGDWLVTDALNCTGVEGTTLTFWRWLGVERSTYDQATILVSTDWVIWVPVWANPDSSFQDESWQFCSYDISAVADDNPHVYVAWGLSTDYSVVYSGWNIDDIQILGDPMPPNDLIYNFPLSYNPGWTMTGGWEWGAGADCCADEAHAGGSWYSHAKGDTGWPDGTYGVGVTDTLTTSAIDCTGLTDVHVSFWRMLGLANYFGPDDEASVQVSNNGTTWTIVWSTRKWLGEDGYSAEYYWHYCEYDISAIADNQPTVYVRWVMGPTDGACGCYGWNVDDVQITAKSSQPPLQILAWVPYADASREYPNTVAALSGLGEPYVVTESYTSDPATLAEELEGKQVFLVPEPESADTADLTTAGEAFADVLQDFAYDGGTVVVCGEFTDLVHSHRGFMTATGLMTADYADVSFGGWTLTTVLPGEPISASLPGTFADSNATGSYVLGPESTAVVEDAAGDAVFAYRDYGFGAAVMVGFDYFEYDAHAAQVLVNAVRYPRSKADVVLTDCTAYGVGPAREALNRLHVPYAIACLTNLDAALAGEPWDLAVVDMPMYPLSTYAAGVPDYVAGGGKAALSTYTYDTQPDLCAAFGVTAGAPFGTPLPVYQWDSESTIFSDPYSVPDPLTWAATDRWIANGNYLSSTGADAEALAGFAATPTEGQAAVVMANEGRTIINGFLWDDVSVDADADAVLDNVQLVMNEILALARRPDADFDADWSGTYGPLPVTFTDLTEGVVESWSWDFGDGGTSAEPDPVHTYTSIGSFTVSLTASNSYNSATETKLDLVTVTALAPAADFSASTTLGYIPLEVTFTDLSANGPTEWLWDFGDTGTSDVQNPTYIYTDAGTFTVSLTATSFAGSDTETKADYIRAVAPAAADFSATPTMGTPPLSVDFTDESTGTVESWEWDFGDTGTATEQNPSHEYADLGSYDVSLTVTNAMGSDTETKAGCIEVVSPVAAAFSASTTAGTVPLAVTFTDHSTGSPTEWEWDFGDGATSTEQSPSHTYGDPGYYTVTLTASKGVVADVEERPGCIAAGFIDTPTDNWAFYYILACATADVVQGYWDNSYKPTDPVNRGQMAVYIARALAGGEGSVPDPSVTEPSFTDVAADHWAYRYVEYVKEQEVVQGYPDGSYQPDAVVNRGQMAVYIARAVATPTGDAGVPEVPPDATPTFPDVTAENAWSWCHKYVEYIATLEPPVTTGYPDGMYHPEREVTRDQMAVYVQRAFDLPIYLPSS